jgi:hypothetical protein
MALDLAADLATFFNADEFGVFAVIGLPAGDLQISGVASTLAEHERPGGNSSSSLGAFMVGAADFNLQATHFLTPWAPVATARPECLLTISTGNHAGQWRVRDIQRDGDIARLILNEYR